MNHSRWPSLLCTLSFALLIAGCGSEPSDEDPAPPVEITLQEELAIESGENEAGDAPLLASVSTVATGPDGTLYIYDGRSHRIMKYDGQGNFLGAFGREGKGPGEFGSVLAMAADSRDRLIVYDGGNVRFSIYDREGNLLSSVPLTGLRSVRDMDEMPDGSFLVTGWNEENNRLLHFFNADFTRIETSLADLDKVAVSEDSRIMNSWHSRPGSAVPLGTDRIALAPNYYSGKILIYERGGGETWSLTRRISGYTTVEEPLLVTTQGSNSPTSALGDIPAASIVSIMVRQGGLTVVRARSRSYGIHRTTDGNLIHFSARFGEEGIRYITENFNPGSTGLVRHGQLLDGMEESYRIEGMAADGSLYLSQPDSARFLKMKMEGLF